MKQERFLTHHNDTQKNWEHTIHTISQMLSRPTSESIISRSENYREKVEKTNVLEMATPSDVRYGAQNWYMSLRHSDHINEKRNHTVHVGNNYTGLWMMVTDNPNKQPEISRKPLQPHGTFKTFKDNPFLKEKMKKEMKRIKELLPTKEENLHYLQIVGKNLFKIEYEGFCQCTQRKCIEVNQTEDNLEDLMN